jgi:hypothetical protein
MQQTLNTWKIAYTITEGEHEYGDYITRELPATALDERAAAALVADRWYTEEDGPEERERFLRELLEVGWAFLPCGCRAISELGWEKVSPITVTVRNGFVEAVTGVPVDVTVEVQDWDNGELDAQGEPVPTVSEWTGPL